MIIIKKQLCIIKKFLTTSLNHKKMNSWQLMVKNTTIQSEKKYGHISHKGSRKQNQIIKQIQLTINIQYIKCRSYYY